MDYIIFGIGTSATLVLIGWILREWGPHIRDRKPAEDEILSARDLVTRMAWTRFCATCGMALVICGVLLGLVTIAVLLLAPSDRFATRAVLIAFGLAILWMFAWLWLYLRQFGAAGILRPRERTSLSTTPTPATASPDTQAMPEVAASAATPTFAETAAARGGLSRFKDFFRREETAVTESPVATAAESPDAAEAPPVEALTVTPTDAVIAELVSASDDVEDKRLSVNDPLVTSVRSDQGSEEDAGIEEALVSDVLGSSPKDDEPDDQPEDEASSETSLEFGQNADDFDADTSAESPPGDRPAHEVALENLRKRRLARLAQDPDHE